MAETEVREKDVRALLQAGADIQKLEELYSANLVHKVAKTMIREDSSKGHLAPLILERATSSRLRSALGDNEFLDEVIKSLLSEPKDELLMDPIMMTLMKDPVVLSSGFIVDRGTTIDENGVMKIYECPFTRQTLSPTVYPLVPLKAKIVQFELHRLDQCIDAADRFITAEKWDRATQVFDIANSLLEYVGDSKYLHKARRLATLERCMPGMKTIDQIIKIYKRLMKVAPPSEVNVLVLEVTGICMENAKRILKEGGAEEASHWCKRCFELIHLEKTLDRANAPEIELCSMALDCCKILDNEKDIWAQRRIIKSLLTGDELSKWLASEGLTGNEEELQDFYFDPSLWSSDVFWLDASMGIARVDKERAIQSTTDLNPSLNCDHWIEVAFYPKRLQYRSYANTVFSQHGPATGWEIRCNDDGVELVWTTESDNGWQHNEFFNTSKAGLLNQWTHVVVTFEEAHSRVTLYVDGVPESRVLPGSFKPYNGRLPFLGCNSVWDNRYFDGYVAFAVVKSELPVAPGALHSQISNLSQKRLKQLSNFALPKPSSIVSQDDAEIRIPLDRCFDVQWNPPGHPTLNCNYLNVPYNDRYGERTGYYTFLVDDEIIYFVRKRSDGSTYQVFSDVVFVALSEDVLMFESEGCYGTLIKGKNISADTSNGSWSTETANETSAKEWLISNFL